MTRPPQLIEVPVDTPESACTGPQCRKPIYWIRTAAGKNMPVDCHAPVEGCRPPALLTPGQGVAHWGTCLDAEYFRRAPAKGATK